MCQKQDYLLHAYQTENMKLTLMFMSASFYLNISEKLIQRYSKSSQNHFQKGNSFFYFVDISTINGIIFFAYKIESLNFKLNFLFTGYFVRLFRNNDFSKLHYSTMS